MKRVLMYVVCGVFLLSAGVATATELVWMPINPAFGGYAANASWLMASATAQNDHLQKSAPYTSPDLMADFQRSLNRQLLYRLSSKILNEAFGEETLLPEGETEAQYTIGDYTINISTDLTQITIDLNDAITGDSTTIEIPYY